jgi:hypothetical protein
MKLTTKTTKTTKKDQMAPPQRFSVLFVVFLSSW